MEEMYKIYEITYNTQIPEAEIASTEISEEEYNERIQCLMKKVNVSDPKLAEVFYEGVFFPYNRIYRKVPKIEIAHEVEKSCNKYAKGKGTTAPGVLIFYCIKHEKLIGFKILQTAESVSQVTEIFLTRFKTVPKVIIYDNGCNLLEYALNR